jgi:hypothetical protein
MYKSTPYTVYVSDRGLPLLYHGAPSDKPILSMEDYCKWYTIYAVMPSGVVAEIHFEQYQHAASRVTHFWSDHVPNPHACDVIAETVGGVWCDRSLEVISGRYRLD